MILLNRRFFGKMKLVVNSLNSNLTAMVRTPLESNFFNQTKDKKIFSFFFSLSFVSRFIFDLVFVQVLHLSWLNASYIIPKFTAPLLHKNFGAEYMSKINFEKFLKIFTSCRFRTENLLLQCTQLSPLSYSAMLTSNT